MCGRTLSPIAPDPHAFFTASCLILSVHHHGPPPPPSPELIDISEHEEVVVISDDDKTPQAITQPPPPPPVHPLPASYAPILGDQIHQSQATNILYPPEHYVIPLSQIEYLWHTILRGEVWDHNNHFVKFARQFQVCF